MVKRLENAMDDLNNSDYLKAAYENYLNQAIMNQGDNKGQHIRDLVLSDRIAANTPEEPLNDFNANGQDTGFSTGSESKTLSLTDQYYNFMNNKEFFIDAVRTKDPRLKFVRKQGPNLKSIIWTTFSVIYFEGEITNFVKCDRCDHVYKYDRRTTGTSTLNRHPCIRYTVLGVSQSSDFNSRYNIPNNNSPLNQSLSSNGNETDSPQYNNAPSTSLNNNGVGGERLKIEEKYEDNSIKLRDNMLYNAAQENDLPTMVPFNSNSNLYYSKNASLNATESQLNHTFSNNSSFPPPNNHSSQLRTDYYNYKSYNKYANPKNEIPHGATADDTKHHVVTQSALNALLKQNEFKYSVVDKYNYNSLNYQQQLQRDRDNKDLVRNNSSTINHFPPGSGSLSSILEKNYTPIYRYSQHSIYPPAPNYSYSQSNNSYSAAIKSYSSQSPTEKVGVMLTTQYLNDKSGNHEEASPQNVDTKIVRTEEENSTLFWGKIANLGLMDEFVNEIKCALDDLKHSVLRELMCLSNSATLQAFRAQKNGSFVQNAKKFSNIVNELNLMNKLKIKLSQHQHEIQNEKDKIGREMNDLKRKLEIQERQHRELYKRFKCFDELIELDIAPSIPTPPIPSNISSSNKNLHNLELNIAKLEPRTSSVNVQNNSICPERQVPLNHSPSTPSNGSSNTMSKRSSYKLRIKPVSQFESLNQRSNTDFDSENENAGEENEDEKKGDRERNEDGAYDYERDEEEEEIVNDMGIPENGGGKELRIFEDHKENDANSQNIDDEQRLEEDSDRFRRNRSNSDHNFVEEHPPISRSPTSDTDARPDNQNTPTNENHDINENNSNGGAFSLIEPINIKAEFDAFIKEM